MFTLDFFFTDSQFGGDRQKTKEPSHVLRAGTHAFEEERTSLKRMSSPVRSR
jgi:hypothetical protein